MLNKERAVDMYKLSAYFLARTTSDLPLDLFLPVIFMVIVYFMAGLKATATHFFLSVLTVFLSIIAAQVLKSELVSLCNTIQSLVLPFVKGETWRSNVMLAYLIF